MGKLNDTVDRLREDLKTAVHAAPHDDAMLPEDEAVESIRCLLVQLSCVSLTICTDRFPGFRQRSKRPIEALLHLMILRRSMTNSGQLLSQD